MHALSILSPEFNSRWPVTFSPIHQDFIEFYLYAMLWEKVLRLLQNTSHLCIVELQFYSTLSV